MPRLEKLRQNSTDWHDWRRGGLGSSHAPGGKGNSPLMMPRELWEVKNNRTEGPDRHNNRTRPRPPRQTAGRAADERKPAEIMEPHCVSHDQLSWMRASLDGLNLEGSLVLESKCPLSSRDHSLALEGQVPRHYYAQLQHQLEVSHARERPYWSSDGRKGALVKVIPDHGYTERLVQTEIDFWRRVTENQWSEPRFKDQDLSDDPKWSEAARCYRRVRQRLDELSSQERELREKLLDLSDARRAFGSGVELIRTSRKGAVNYGSIPELEGVDLEQYRKEPVAVVKINIFSSAQS